MIVCCITLHVTFPISSSREESGIVPSGIHHAWVGIIHIVWHIIIACHLSTHVGRRIIHRGHSKTVFALCYLIMLACIKVSHDGILAILMGSIHI